MKEDEADETTAEVPESEVSYELKSVKEAAQLLRVSETTVWRYADQDLLPAYRVGRKRVMFRRGDLESLLNRLRRKKEPMKAASKLRLMSMSENAGAGTDAIARARDVRAGILVRRGGIAVTESWRDIDAAPGGAHRRSVNGFVCIDACVAVKWVVPEHDSATADALFARITTENDAMIAPPHMPVEVVNALRKKVLHKEITPAESERALASFLSFPVSIAAPEGLYESAFLLAQRFDRPTVYDTHYVALAEIAGCEMWTADQRLLNALGGRLPFVKSLSSFSH